MKNFYLAKIKDLAIYPTPMSAIRLRCMECCGNSHETVRECTDWACPLWSYRSGHRDPEPLPEQARAKIQRRYDSWWGTGLISEAGRPRSESQGATPGAQKEKDAG